MLVAAIAAMAVAIPTPAFAVETIFETDFEDGVDVFSDIIVHPQPLADGHVGAGLKAVIPAEGHWGASGHWNFADHGVAEPDELYWRYWLRFPTGFYITPRDRGKLPGVGGLYNYRCLGGRASTSSEPCFSARMLFSRNYAGLADPDPNGPSDATLIGFYAYHLDGPADRGDILTWDPEVALLPHGPWHCVEGRIRMNDPGQSDGVLEGWVDGQPAFSRDDLRFRRSTESWMHIKSFWFDVYYGGDATPVANEVHFDSLAFGPERIGCSDIPVFDGTFADDDGSVFEADIEWLAETGITKGCGEFRFCPDDPVTRGQMAAFLSRALTLDPGDDPGFTDLQKTEFADDIRRLAAAGITRGCNPPANDRFCPDDPVTRGQMAAFLVRAFGYSDRSGTFVDDDESVFEADIERLAAAGVTKGCNPPDNDRFCPDDPVTRAEMAAFLHRALAES